MDSKETKRNVILYVMKCLLSRGVGGHDPNLEHQHAFTVLSRTHKQRFNV